MKKICSRPMADIMRELDQCMTHVTNWNWTPTGT